MASKFSLFILFLLYMLVDGKKSFVIVMDTTASMRDEINSLKNHIGFDVNLTHSGHFENYIVVPFTDPVVGVPIISSTPEGLLNSLSDLEVKGGTDCPENSLSAVEKALEIGKDYSNIFLFTDAPAKDIKRLPFIQTLCRQRQSQVVTFLSGECPGEPRINMNVYNEIAQFCSGSTFHLDIQNLRQAVKYMKNIVSVEWSDINTHKEFTGRKQFNFHVDTYTKEIIVAVGGDYPEIQVADAARESVNTEVIMSTKRALVLRLSQPPTGEYVVDVCSRGQSLTTFYKWRTLEFKYGFSPKKPISLSETTRAPVPDVTSYLVVEQLDSAIEVFLVELQTDTDKITLDINVLDEEKKIYMVQSFFQADKSFRICIHGREKITREVIKGTSPVIHPQLKIPPRTIEATVEAIKVEPTLVEFMANVTLFCKVTGEPKPDIWWEDDVGNRIESEDVLFEWPSTYISYAMISNATTNTTVFCKAKNLEEQSSLSEDLFVHREFAFEILQSPVDTVVEYGTEGKLFCEATAYPEATIRWYRKESDIENTENLQIVQEENMLLIKNMTLNDVGEYMCVVTNGVEQKSLSAIVDISGVEAPSIEIANAEYIISLGDSIEVECKIILGSPTPEVTWKMEVDDEIVEFADEVFAEGNVLKISSAKADHSGNYTCTATNVMGEDSKDVIVKVQYAPNITKGDEIKMVNVGETVELECDVKAKPKAVVHWNMYQDDVIMAFNDRHNIDDRYTLRFIAQMHDSGSYFCVAENDLGRSERNVTVIILEAPFIEPLDFKSLKARVGSTLQVTCNVSLGSPVPVTRWEFFSARSSATVISRKTTTKLDLVLRNISKANEGYYQCISENQVAPDSIKFYLNVLQ